MEEVASPEGFANNPQLVLDFYNTRRRQLKEVSPNRAHCILHELEQSFDVHIITQNVDDLHERAGSGNVLHLHGELKKARPVNNKNKIIFWEDDLNWGDLDENGIQLRPHIVWFGESVNEMENAIKIVSTADIFIVVGTSMQVYPAAGLIDYIPDHCEIYVIDPNLSNTFTKNENYFKMTATEGMEKLKSKLAVFN